MMLRSFSVTEWALLFGGALTASIHCAGMCGGFVASIGLHSCKRAESLVHQLTYQAGRISMYLFLGTLAGYFGQAFRSAHSTYTWLQALLSVVAGITLIYLGCKQLLQLLAWSSPSASKSPNLVQITSKPAGNLTSDSHAPSKSTIATSFAGLMRNAVQTKGTEMRLLAGMLTGLLPCGLTYSYLLLAMASQSPIMGMLIMLALGLGTMPVLLAVGCGSQLVHRGFRHLAVGLAACCLLGQGIVTIDRGLVRFWYPNQALDSCSMDQMLNIRQ